MIWHPLALAVWLGDLLAWAIGLDAARRLITALPRWDPAAGDRFQLLRERSLELAAYQGQWVLMFQSGTLLLLIIGISNVWTAIVPGAMCGTGVLQAMGPSGQQTILFRAAALLIFFAWRTAVRINGRHPEGMLWPFIGRIFLLGLPLMILGSVTWGQAIAAVDPGRAVDCCAVVYAQAAGQPSPVQSAAGSGGHAWILTCMTGAFLIVGTGMVRWRRPAWGGRLPAILLGAFTLLWAAVSVQALRFGFGPYIYEVLQHPCPWCFFLPEHYGVGFILFGSLAVVCIQQIAAGVAASIAEKQTVLTDAALAGVRSSQFKVVAAALVFGATAMFPVLSWRLQFGGWMF